jgi:hypothetical protein
VLEHAAKNISSVLCVDIVHLFSSLRIELFAAVEARVEGVPSHYFLIFRKDLVKFVHDVDAPKLVVGDVSGFGVHLDID